MYSCPASTDCLGVCRSRGHAIAAGRPWGPQAQWGPALTRAFWFCLSCFLTSPVWQEGGLEGLKLYGMVGVPGEEEADVDATIAMMQQLRKAAPKLRWASCAQAQT